MIEEGDLDCSVCKKIMKKDVIDGPHNTSGICPECKEKMKGWIANIKSSQTPNRP